MGKRLNPTVKVLLKAYLKQDNVKVELKKYDDDEHCFQFVIKEDDKEVLRVTVPEDKLKLFNFDNNYFAY